MRTETVMQGVSVRVLFGSDLFFLEAFAFIPECGQSCREGGEYPVQNSLQKGDAHAVVRDGYSRFRRHLQARQNFPAIQHTAAAMNGQFVVGKVFRVIASGVDVDLHSVAKVVFQPAGNFDSSNIVLCGMVGACFGDQDFVSFSERIFLATSSSNGRGSPFFTTCIVPAGDVNERSTREGSKSALE